MNEKIKEVLENLPELPGSYQMYDKNGVIIYVGKAKNLKNRVRSYFVGAHNNKTTALVSKIEDIKYIITDNEREAFLLEISLIKEHNPFYNIDLTDDKTYPYIEFTKEKHPRLIITRHLTKNNTRFFGPYTNVIAARKTIELLNKIYKLRKCSTVPKKSCIYYEMNECSGPCINEFTKEEYDDIYKNIKGLLYGNDLSIVNDLKKEMIKSSENLDFENAKKCRDLIKDINDTLVRQDVIIKDKIDADVFGFSYDDLYLSYSLIYLRGGRIILSKQEVVPYYFDLDETILWAILKNYQNIDPPKNIFVDKEYNDSLKILLEDKTEVLTPLKGPKAKLLEIARENADLALKNKNKIHIDKSRKALEELSSMLNIPIPTRIESFDNSNLFGDSPVSSLVVFINGKKAPKEYRKYHVKTIVGPNDFGTMKEVTYRRYKRVKDGEFIKPDLILIDGGETQVKACIESLNLLDLDINVCGMKKDDTHTTSTLIFNNVEYGLDKHSSVYKFLCEVQEEVHRFAITYHRTLKEKNDFTSILDNINGIGPILKTSLLKEYKSIEGIRNATDESLKNVGLSEKTIKELRRELLEEIDFE